MKCYCASVCVLLTFGFVCGQSPCVTPAGDSGDCRSILECPRLLTVLNKHLNKPSLASDEVALLRRSACGYTGKIPKVCCPTTKEQPPMVPKICVTPEGSQGECVSVFDCAHVVMRLQSATVTSEDKAYVNSIRCQAPKAGFSVCCGSPNPPSTRRSESSTAPPDLPSTGGSAPFTAPSDSPLTGESVPSAALPDTPSTGGTAPYTAPPDSPSTGGSKPSATPPDSPLTAGSVHYSLPSDSPLTGGSVPSAALPDSPLTRGSTPYTTPSDSSLTGRSALSDPHTKCGEDATSGDKLYGVGGFATFIDEYPWLAIVERRNRENVSSLVCGGALISARYVLTAAHCVTGVAGPPSTVRLGEYDTSHPGRDCVNEFGEEDCADEPVVIPIELVVPHHSYDARSKRHDIALLRLSERAPYTYFIRSICLPTMDVAEFARGERLVVAGWGANETHSTSSVKLAIDLPYKSIKECQLAYNGPRRRARLWRGQLCAGGEPGRDSCKGDSGGPLMHFSYPRGVFEVTGIVSFGATPCGLEHVPGVYTKVYEYLAWIRNNMEP